MLESETYSLEDVRYKIKIELFWNELIFDKYNDQVSINREKLIEKINSMKNKEKKEFFLSEIVFKKKIDETIEQSIAKIRKSIDEIGFNNSANIYSISESSKYGGKIGWVNEDSLSKKIYENIINLKNNEYSNVMNLNNNFVILKVEDHRIVKNTVDKKRT